jgi:hypothetical protein
MAFKGPVGALGPPESAEGFERLEGDGIALLVHRDVLVEASSPDRFRFHFGAFSWCWASLAARGHETAPRQQHDPDR